MLVLPMTEDILKAGGPGIPVDRMRDSALLWQQIPFLPAVFVVLPSKASKQKEVGPCL